MSTVFQDYASYYDLLNSGKPYQKEVAYIISLAERYCRQPVQRILDLGCGTGIHACLLAEEGYAVTGIDRSEGMLDIARKRAHGLVSPVLPEFLSGDATTFSLAYKFDIVLSLFHVVSYQTTSKDLKAMFAQAASHLNERGLFIFDLWYGPAVLHLKPEARTRRAENQEFSVCRTATPTLHPEQNCVEVHYDIDIVSKPSVQNPQDRQLQETHVMRYLFLPELETLLEQSGFILHNAEEWLTGARPGLETWSVCCVAEKKRSAPL